MSTRSWGFSMTFGALLLLVCGAGTLRADVIYRMNAPAGLNVFGGAVTDVFRVTINGVTKNIEITVDSNDDGISKARKLAAAINDPVNGFGPGSAAQQNDDHGRPSDTVKIVGGTVNQAKGGNKSGEGHGQLYSSLILPDEPFPYDAVFAATGPIAGTDLSGAPSTFSASFGWDGFSDDFTSTFAGLSAPTPDGLIADMYSQLLAGLPGPLQGNLMLDTADDEILFRFPNGQQNYFEASTSTDELIDLVSGFQPVPEPATLWMLLTGAAALFARQHGQSRMARRT
jgi:hypothetical protein